MALTFSEEDMLVRAKIRSISTTQGFVRNGETVDLPEAEVRKIMVTRPDAFEILPQPAKKPAAFKSKRAAKVEASDD